MIVEENSRNVRDKLIFSINKALFSYLKNPDLSQNSVVLLPFEVAFYVDDQSPLPNFFVA